MSEGVRELRQDWHTPDYDAINLDSAPLGGDKWIALDCIRHVSVQD